ncbi:MAG: nucleotide-binding protein [Pseudomonas sp.]|nr:nucleotide-binding protein [Pseudomonas sp.]
MSIYKEIILEADRLKEFLDYDYSEVSRLLDEAGRVAPSWSGSWLGYHSCVYYENLEAPPAGAHFSTEWGLYSDYGMGSTGNWVEYSFKDIVNYIQEQAGNPDLSKTAEKSIKAKETIDDVRHNTLALIHSRGLAENDNFLQKLIEEMEAVKIPSKRDFLKNSLPRGQLSTRDNRVENKISNPPHKVVECTVYGITSAFSAAGSLYKIIQRVSKYLQNLESKMAIEERIGTNIFIGHGRSHDWRDLKDFISERLNLPWDEFNRVPVAGLTNITRLAQMLDQACIALLVMSAEDEQAEGNHHARMNVIHEVGLFQGRLGFERAIVLLEEGCEEFSNIQGLGQIRYPKGNISAVFEDIRQVLERENII